MSEQKSNLILSAGLFSGEATREFVCFNEVEVEVSKARREHAEKELQAKIDAGEPVGADELPEVAVSRGAYFHLKPVTADLDADYTKRRGQDVHNLKLRPKGKGESGPNLKFEAMDVSISLPWTIREVSGEHR